MNLNDILSDPPKPHEGMVMGLTEGPLSFIYENVNHQSNTLETGCGLSTVVFALTGSRHIVIAPAPSEFEITKSYCRERGIPTQQIEFIAEASQKVLPSLESPALDLVLIDGGHGFPTPYVDWFYTAGRLKKGGYLIVDDVWLWSCQILRDFLMEQPHWQFVDEYSERTTVFRKLEDGSEWLEWTEQPLPARGGKIKWVDGQMVMDQSVAAAGNVAALKRGVEDLKRGNFRNLAGKIGRRLFSTPGSRTT
jgi:hypothetical protein